MRFGSNRGSWLLSLVVVVLFEELRRLLEQVQRFFRFFREVLQELVCVDHGREEVVDRGIEDHLTFARVHVGVRLRLGASRAELVVEVPVLVGERGGRDDLADLGPVGQQVQAVGLRLQGLGVRDRLVLSCCEEGLEAGLRHEQVERLFVFHHEVGDAKGVQQCQLGLGVHSQHGTLLAEGTN